MIIRIPIFLQPVEDGLSRCGEVLHHMNNAIKGKATEAPIKDIIKFHNDTFHRVNFNYKNMLQNLPEAPFTPYGSRKKRFLDLLFGIAGTAFGVSQSNRNHKNQLYNCKEHSQNGHDGRYSTAA
jgi:hypothetical protein